MRFSQQQGKMYKVQLISTENIKPSSPTPLHLHNFKLTLLDQRFPRTYTPIIYFYSGDNGNNNISKPVKIQQLQESLSETLTQFYPLAGRLSKEGSVIECNDEGVDFSEASVEGELSEFLKQPNIDALNQMVPCSLWHPRSGRDVLMAVQVNLFDCGGMAFGMCMSHKIADGSTGTTFFNAWANASRGSVGEAKGPQFQSSELFPTEGHVPMNVVPKMEEAATKTFVFDASKIALLRRGRSTDLEEFYPSRYQAVAALIWRCMMRIHGGATFVAMQAVNMRGRMVPPLPENSFGNLVTNVVSVASEGECHGDMQRYLERKLRDATREVDVNYIKELQKPDGILKVLQSMNSKVMKHPFCRLVSFLGLPWYEPDFGWGKPIWVSPCSYPLKNCVLLIETRSGGGIEAWVNMEREDMVKFEQDEELLSFVSFLLI